MKLRMIERIIKAKICYLPKPKFKVNKWSTVLCDPQVAHNVPCSFLFPIPAMSLGFENWSCLKAGFHIIADRRKFCDRLRSYGNTLPRSPAIICDRLQSCDHMETKVLRSKCIP